MKKLTVSIAMVFMAFVLVQCAQKHPNELCNDTKTRGQIISELMKNQKYLAEVMDSIKVRHPQKMMQNMMGMCEKDSTMCKMMMDHTMAMCDVDKAKCKMMMGSMKTHMKGMSKMKEMGMCDMKGMKGMKMGSKK
jgi:hypothetical protein